MAAMDVPHWAQPGPVDADPRRSVVGPADNEARGPGIISVSNESRSTATRFTKEGKQITYVLEVVQQPIRARACGSGAKSSSDRRPVDPPPIVELRIFEGDVQIKEREIVGNDITFSMSANYFLFTTLEQARPIVQGRVPEKEGRHPVLTGTTVAGMTYLDRPKPAGYFVFPDLSVRHEGKYRLSFSLFEGLKETKDDDQDEDTSRSSGPESSYVTHRSDVRSIPFTVFSAKKFPGLTESTALSRIIAEQGCRVRIRRDVRMRRRPDGKGQDWDGYEAETAEARARMSATPDPSPYSNMPTPSGFCDPVGRPRSTSVASAHPAIHDMSRRSSLQDLSRQFHAGRATSPQVPQAPQSSYPYGSPYGPSPAQQFHQPYVPAQTSMQPPPVQYQSHQQIGLSATSPVSTASSSRSAYFGYAPLPPTGPPQPVYPGQGYDPPSHHQHLSIDSKLSSPLEPFRPSQYLAPPPAPAPAGFPAQSEPQYYYTQPPPPQTQPSYSSYQQPQPSFSQDSFGKRPAPLQPVQPPARLTGAATPTLLPHPPMDKSTKLAPLHIPHAHDFLPDTSSPSHPISAPPVETNKRSHSQVFNERELAQPLRRGARPGTPIASSSAHHLRAYPGGVGGFDPGAADDSDAEAENEIGRDVLQYRRANGYFARRERPAYD